MQWLNTNSAGVQALATIVLVAITGVYVVLTRRLVSEASRQAGEAVKQTALLQQQVDIQQNELKHLIGRSEEERRDRVQESGRRFQRLADLANGFRSQVEALPDAVGLAAPIDRLRAASLWRKEDVAELKRLAADRGEVVTSAAVAAAGKLDWLEERISQVRGTPVGPQSANLPGIFARSYGESREQARVHLERLVAALGAKVS